MKERPILFSAPMVCALLDGSKTQTRRIVKNDIPANIADYFPYPRQRGDYLNFHERQDQDFPMWNYCIRNPYGKPGDRLWVRETSCVERLEYPGIGELGLFNTYCADNASLPIPKGREPLAQEHIDQWAAKHVASRKVVPSIHMPRWASRITLEITDVRVQRLQDISEEDAAAEGFGSAFGPGMRYRAFDSMWDGINGEGTWDTNPWVWALTFHVIN